MITFLVINLILLVLSLILMVAKASLLNYGECSISVNNGEKVIKVEGGQNLLSLLNDNGFSIPSACGSKASCGYCKVRVEKGGGQILPTEEGFMSHDEKLSNTRLACQVKVKNDMEVVIPDFLETVREMVKNETFDSTLKWQWKIKNPFYVLTSEHEAQVCMEPEKKEKIHEIITSFKNTKGPLMPVLQSINSEFKYFPEASLRQVALEMDLPLSKVSRVATSYNAFSLVPRGENTISVCTGTTCYVKGSGKITAKLSELLGIEMEKTTNDMKFTLKSVRCIGCCSIAPAVMINEKVYGHVKLNQLSKIIKDYQ